MRSGLGLWLVACKDPSVQAAEEEARLAVTMVDLEEHSAGIRDAVVRGDLPDARARAGRLASTLQPLPPGPIGIGEQLKLALAEVSGAATLADAARGVGQIAQTCGTCHTAERAGSAGRPAWNVRPTRVSEMARHALTVDQLWVALVRGSDSELATAVSGLDQSAAGTAATGIDRRAAELGHALLAAAPDARAAAYGELLATCGSCHAANRPRAMPKLDGVTLPSLQPQMDRHFLSALELQLALIGGDLDAAHRAAASLTETPQPVDLPPAAQAWLGSVRSAADRGAVAPTLADAGRAMADVGLACAGCHTATGGGPKDKIPPAPDDTPHMGLHLYGAYWLGYGVYAPDERAWKAGAAALADARVTPDGWQPPPGTEPADLRIHALGTRALTTADAPARAALWSELLQSCAPCHQQLPDR